jgi:hypothetical protein
MVDDLFVALDAPFIKFNKNIEPIIWQSQDILVQRLYDIRIPASAGSTIKYTFSTQVGDIYFCAQFLIPGQADEIIVEPNRVPSDIEQITGTYKSVRDGTFLMIFDNNFSWFNHKILSYKILLYQVISNFNETNILVC